MKNVTYSLYSLKNTVFTTSEIAIILKETNSTNLRAKIYRLTKKGVLINLARGLYAKSSNYNILEAANKIYTPSYISLETILQKEGVTFQDYSKTIFVISYLTRDITLDGYTISFRKIRDSILRNPTGIVNEEGYSIASTERAFLDRVYMSKNYHFDNLDQIDWKKAKRLVKIYNNKAMERRFKSYVSDFFTPNSNE